MNLTRAALDRYGFRSVWFNAWHHQTEEYMLAALLETLRRDAVPSWWRPDGLAVRLRLLSRRGSRQLVPGIAALAVFALALGYIWRDPKTRLDAALAFFVGFFKKQDNPSDALGALALFGALAPLVPALRGMRTFVVDTKKIFGAGDGTAQKPRTGFRQQFAESFDDLVTALSPRRLILFVDDLDRCQPAVVLSVLEMVNFLVSSADCFIVLGMARERVERCVGLGFKDVAEELTDAPQAAKDDGQQAARMRRADFARNYLEKLINVEVPVPRATPEQSRALLGEAPRPLPGRWAAASSYALGVTRRYSPVLVAVVVSVMAFLYGSSYWQPPATVEPAAAPTAAAVPARAPTPQASESRSPAESSAPDLGRADDPEPPVLPRERPTRGWPLFAIGIVLVGLYGTWKLTVPAVRLEKDSNDFKAALDLWYPLVAVRSTTPRSIKRFLNRVRFYAMRQRRDVPQLTVWEKLRGEPAAPPAKPAATAEIPEKVLVALTAIQHGKPAWLSSTGFWESPTMNMHAEDQLTNQDRAQLKRELETLEPLEAYHEAFSILSAGVHIGS